MIVPSSRNELEKELVEERLREAERERLARAAGMRTRSNRTWVSWWLSRLARWTGARRSPQPDRAVSGEVIPQRVLRIQPERSGIFRHV